MRSLLYFGGPPRELIHLLLGLFRDLHDNLAWVEVKDVTLGPPLRRPGKIIAVGLNYREHVEEQQGKVPEYPVVFAKFPSAVIGPDEPIRLPSISQAVDYEAELGVVIGKRAKDVPVEDAAEYVAGYTIINDVTARDLQKSDRQWVRAKSLDTFCPMGPWLVTRDEWEFPPRRDVTLWVNGEVRQQANTSMMLHDVADLVSWLSRAFTLEPGDVIATGTPSGVGAFRQPPVFLEDGDVVEIEIEGLGRLRNPVSR